MDTKNWGICNGFAAFSNLNFGFPKFGGRSAPRGFGFGGVRRAVSEFLYVMYTKPLNICYGFAAVLNLNFGFPKFGGRMP